MKSFRLRKNPQGAPSADSEAGGVILVAWIPLIIFALFGVWSLISAIRNWIYAQSLPENPTTIELSQVGAALETQSRLWVTIPEVEWDCDNLVVTRKGKSTKTSILFANESRSIVGIAEFRSELTCEKIEQRGAEGEIQRMSPSSREGLPEKGFDLTPYTDATTWLDLCTDCGRDSSMHDVRVNLFMVFIAGFLFFDYLYRYRKRNL